MLNLAPLPVIDHHCHPLFPDPWVVGEEAFVRLFTESRDEEQIRLHGTQTIFYRRAVRDLAGALGSPPDAALFLERRRDVDREAYLRRLFAETGLRVLLVDTGYPPGAMALEAMRRLLPLQIEPLVRLEVTLEALIASHDSFGAFLEAFLDVLDRAPAEGVVGYKSIIAYRSGLDIEPSSPEEAGRGFLACRRELQAGRRLRLTSKALLDYAVPLALERAAAQGIPFQFHCGIGDADIDLRRANPLHLRPLLTDARFSGARIILLHAAYPFVREASYLTSLHAGVYLDLSLAIPMAQTDMGGILREALALAPWTKLLYGSDLGGIPEAYWLGALHGKWALAACLDGLVADGVLTRDEAMAAARQILHDNAAALYHLLDNAAPDR